MTDTHQRVDLHVSFFYYSRRNMVHKLFINKKFIEMAHKKMIQQLIRPKKRDVLLLHLCRDTKLFG